MKSLDVVTLTAAIVVSSCFAAGQVGKTEITKWQDGKNGAVSLTYDDGSINQFRVAVPIMDNFGLPATFFIITGEHPRLALPRHIRWPPNEGDHRRNSQYSYK